VKRDYFLNEYEAVSKLPIGQYVTDTADYISLNSDGFHYIMSDITIYEDDQTTVIPSSAYILSQDEYYTSKESISSGSGKTLYFKLKITNATYAGMELYISGNNFGTYTTNDIFEAGTVDASFQSVKYGDPGTTAAVAGAGTQRWNATTEQMEVSNGDDWIAVGAGEDFQGFNYDNRNFETNIDGYNTYDDGAVDEPVDGTGGTPTVITIAEETASPLVGDRSLNMSKSAADGQGEGVSYDFSIDRGQLGQTVEFSFLVETSGDYADEDMGFYIYDVDNANLMYPSVVNISSSYGEPSKFFCTFIPSDSVNYRAVWHVQSTNALSWDVLLDNIQVGVFSYNVGDGHEVYDSGWINYDNAFQAINDTILTIPSDRDIGDFNVKITYFDGVETYYVMGDSTITNNGLPSSDIGIFVAVSAGSVFLRTGAGGFWRLDGVGSAQAINDSSTGSLRVVLTRVIKNINTASDFTEYASNSDTSSSSDTTSFAYGKEGNLVPSQTTLATGTIDKYIQFKTPIQPTDIITIEFNTGNNWVLSNPFGYTAEGSYRYGAYVEILDSSTCKVLFGNGGGLSSGSTRGALGTTWNIFHELGWKWRVRKVSNGNMAEQPPIVRAEYEDTSGQSISTSFAITQFDTEIEDTHNMVTTGTGWKATAPINGVYTISVGILTDSESWASGTYKVQLELYINDVADKFITFSYGGAYSGRDREDGYCTVRLSKGDYIGVYSRGSIATNLITSAGYNRITIERIGN
jgi:hypothetical protein